MPARYPTDCPARFINRYFVVAGDTMSNIAQRLGTSTNELIAANPHINNPNEVFPGDVLCVPGFRKPVKCPPGFKNRLEVQTGDTMFSIAKMFNTSVAELVAANPHIQNANILFPGDILCVP